MKKRVLAVLLTLVMVVGMLPAAAFATTPTPDGVQLWENGPCFAECNVGADKPEEYGTYFWWGDDVGYKYDESQSKWVSIDGTENSIVFSGSDPVVKQTLMKTAASLKTAGFVDNETSPILNAAHDAATAHLGEGWRMPTKSEFDALCNNCTLTWTYDWNGTEVNGVIVTGKTTGYTDKSIFLPAAGYGFDSYLIYIGELGFYWSSEPSETDAYFLASESASESTSVCEMSRCFGLPVRAVKDAPVPLPQHSFTYGVNPSNAAQITATCDTGCPDGLDTEPLTLTLTSPANLVYDGSAKVFTFAEGEAAAWEAAGLTVPVITYEAKSGSSLTTDKAVNAGNYIAKAVFENDYTAALDFEITKATPYIKTSPAANEITYGKTLADSTLVGGYVRVSSTDTNEIGGLFEWTDGSIVPGVSDSDTTGYSVTFMPGGDYIANYNTVTCTVTLTVTPVDYADVTKAASGSLGTVSGSTVEITLPAIPEGAAYGTATKTNAEDKYTLSGISGGKITATSAGIDAGTGSMTFSVPVIPDDNHNGYSITVTITPSFKEVVTITADTEDFTYGDSGKTGYEDVEVVDSLVDINTLIVTYYLSDGATKTTTANSGAASEGAVPVNAGNYKVVLSVPENNETYTGSTTVAFTVDKKAVTVTASSKTLYIGDSFENGAVNIGAVITGLLNEDSVSEYELGCVVPFDEAFKLTTAGTYPVVVTVAEDAAGTNYTVTGVNGTLTVSNRPSSGGGSTPTVTVPVSGEENSVDVKVTVSGNTATVQPIKKAEIEKVIGDDVETGMVEIDLSGLKQNVSGVKLPAETVEAIAEAAKESGNDTAGLRLKLSSGSLEFDAKALETIIAAAGNSQNIEIHFDEVGTNRLNADQKAAINEMVVINGYEAFITANGQRISDFEGGTVAIYVPYDVPADKEPAAYTVWYVAEDGTLEKMNATYDGENHRFVVTHFSDYILTYDESYGAYNNCPKDENCPMSKFTDLDITAWYHDGIHYCLDHGIMNGVGNARFVPKGTATRAQIAMVLYNLEGQPAFMNDNIFSDVASGCWYEKAVVWAQGKGIVEGYGNGKFGPEDPITREQMAVILCNYAKYKGIDVTVDENTNFLSFNDFWDISEWAKPAMMWAIDREIIVGSNNNLNPQGNAERSQIATIIWRYCESIIK